jgi:GNAT superfamily N-acetyltransferase
MHKNTCRSKPEITIRRMMPSDAADAAELSAELGYPVATEAMRDRLAQFAELENHAVFGACLEGRVIAWIDIGIVYHLQAGPYGEIGGLIVSSEYQGCGIGRKLVETAERWIAGQRITTVLVRSQIAREGAHAFYLRQNFSRVKTSAVFTKSLNFQKIDTDCDMP